MTTVEQPENNQSYFEAFGYLHSWTCLSLDEYKPELSSVLFPLLAHCYLALIRNSDVVGAARLLECWRADFESTYHHELQSLAIVMSPDHPLVSASGDGDSALYPTALRENAFVSAALSGRFHIAISDSTSSLLLSFLRSPSLSPLLSLLSSHFSLSLSLSLSLHSDSRYTQDGCVHTARS
mmetsp:Transcript_15090/g.15211  ORF Transcript_15090/g.15211 Transcript_15090/m.15211 type:complete len:181 (+) Transcript_15090:133-675(+)